jgi:hypothetical protein
MLMYPPLAPLASVVVPALIETWPPCDVVPNAVRPPPDRTARVGRLHQHVAALAVVALVHEQAYVADAARHGRAGNKRKRAAAALRGGAERGAAALQTARPALAVSSSTRPELSPCRTRW